MKQRAAGCLIIIILCAMCMTGTSLPTLNLGGVSGGDTSVFEDMDFSFGEVPVNEQYAVDFKRDATSDAEPDAVQSMASGSGCAWSENDAQFTVPENTTCLFAISSSPDVVQQFRLLLSQGDTIVFTLQQNQEVTQGGNSDKPIYRLGYDAPPTQTPVPTPTSESATPQATVTPTPTATPGIPTIPTATPTTYQVFQDKAGLLTISECTYFEEPEVEEGLTPEIRDCLVTWVQGDNTEDVWWKSWVSGDFAWSGLFTRE